MTDNIPLISYIIPAYNAADYIERCLNSILFQSLHNIEVIIIDDGSTDNTLVKVNGFASNDNRVKVIHKKNEGQGVARNIGINISRGKYIAFVDSDDFINCHYLCAFEDVLKNDESFDFVNFLMDFRGGGDNVKFALPNYACDFLEGDEIFKCAMLDELIYSSPCNKIYRAGFLKQHDIKFPKIRKNEDIFFSRMLAYFSKRCIFLNKVLYHVNVRDGSTSREMSSSSIKDTIKLYYDLECFLKSKPDFVKNKKHLSASKKKIFSNLVILCSLRIIDDDEYKKAVILLRNSYIYNDFISIKGFSLLNNKNKIMYIFVRLGGRHLSRGILSKFLRKFTY